MKIGEMFGNQSARNRNSQLLDKMGLQKKSSQHNAMTTFGLFGLGVAVGVGLGMLFAPQSGREVRSKAVNKLPMGRHKKSGQTQIYESAR